MEGYQLKRVVIDMIQVGKLYILNDHVMTLPLYERVNYYYPDPEEDYYLQLHDNRFIDWFDPGEPGWGYRYGQSGLKPGVQFLVLDINPRVQHLWAASSSHKADYVAIRILIGDTVSYIYQPPYSHIFTEITSENAHKIEPLINT